MKLGIIECDSGETATLDDRFLVYDQDMQILANCVSREIAETLVRALEQNAVKE